MANATDEQRIAGEPMAGAHFFEDLQRDASGLSTVVVLGTTRIGKSTIINELYHHSVAPDVISQGPAEAKHQSNSVTKQAKMYWSQAQQMLLLDTVGLGDPEKGDAAVVWEVMSVLNAFKGGVTAVLLAIKFGRWSTEEQANMQLLLKMLPKEGLEQHAAIVITHFPSRGCTDRAARVAEWAKDCPELQQLLQRVPTHFCVNNNVVGRATLRDESSREDFLRSAVAFVRNRLSTLRLRPTAWQQFVLMMMDVAARIWRRVFGGRQSPWELLAGISLDALNAAKDTGRELLKTATAGPCSFCQLPVGLNNACYLTCAHALHQECFASLQRAGGSITCPSCGVAHRSEAAVTYDLSGIFLAE